MSQPDLSDRTILITGANSGLGKTSAKALAKMGARVVMACRSQQRGEAACAEIRADVPTANLELRSLDLASFESVRAFAKSFTADHQRLDVLMNNAGMLAKKRSLTGDGFESSLQINHLGPFLLTHLLQPLLVQSAPARIVNLASLMHRFSRGNLDNLNQDGIWVPFAAYNLSKLLNILFSNEIARRLSGTGVTSNALHPGGVATNFGFDPNNASSPMKRITRTFLRSPEKGAETQIWLASDPGVADSTGGYYVGCKSKRPSRAARDLGRQQRLWQLSEEMVGIVAAT